MGRIFKKLREQIGFTAVEAVTVSTVMVFVIVAAYNLLDIGYSMDQQAEDGFEAQAEGREVLTALAKHMRPAEEMNLAGVPILYASNDGTFIDLRVDTDGDGVTELARIALDRTNQQIKMYIDTQDTTGAHLGHFNFEKAGQSYTAYYNPTNSADWDSLEIMADKIVNFPAGGTTSTPWPAQTSLTDPEDDYRLFTFYGDNFELPLDTRDSSPGLGPIWVNYVKGVKIFLLSDIQPAEIPSPFGIQTSINLRNIWAE